VCFIKSMINTREIASFIWLGLLLAFVLTKRDFRRSLGQIVRLFLHPKIAIPVLAYVLLLALLVWGASRSGWWSEALLGETITWFIFSGLVLFFEVTKTGKEEHFFRRTALEIIGVGAFLEFFVNVKTFSLPFRYYCNQSWSY
jgi:hypothetical protein